MIVDRVVLVGESGASHVELLALIADQRVVIDGLVAQNEALVAQVAELRRRLGLNSSNSSRPPSSDGLAKPAPRSLRQRSGRKPGKQPGTPGKTLRQVDDPDEVIEYLPSACTGCRGSLGAAEVVNVVRRQVFDLPEIRRRVTEYRLVSCRCVCGTVSAAAAPAGVNAPVQYGPGIAAVALYLLVGHHIPFERVVAILDDVLGCAPSPGWVRSAVSRAATALTGFRGRLREGLARAGVVHFDESGVRVDGRLRWAHVACTPLLTHYHLDDRRGQVAIDAHGILPQMRSPQVAVHDGWMPYLKKSYDSTDHALCNAHHLRELTGWAETSPQHQPWATRLSGLLQEGNRRVKQAVAGGQARLDPTTLSDLDSQWRHALAQAYAANPPPASRGRGPILALIDRLHGYTTEIWRFAHDFTVTFDNNQAERDIRMIKLQPKISGCWRTTHGATDWLRIREYLSTTAKHRLNTLTALRDAITGNAWMPPLPE